MEAKHTKGPWAAYGQSVYSGDGNKSVVMGMAYCTDYIVLSGGSVPNPISREEAEANASLMSAAPELLAACENALDVLSCFRDGEGSEETCDCLEKAIAKAKGES